MFVLYDLLYFTLGSAHAGDWQVLKQGVAWMQEAAKNYTDTKVPFFVYQGRVTLNTKSPKTPVL